MKEIIQLNENAEWGGQPRNQHRFYNVYGKSPALVTKSEKVAKILILYENSILPDTI